MVRAMDRFAPGQWGRVIFAGQGLFLRMEARGREEGEHAISHPP